MPEMQNRGAKETAFASALRGAWEPFDRKARAGEEPDWDALAEATAKAAEEHIQAARRLAAVVLWLMFLDDMKELASQFDQPKPESGKQLGDSLEPSDRAEKLGREVARTSRDRWRQARRGRYKPRRGDSPEDRREGERRNQQADEELADSLYGADRSGTVAVTELTMAQSDGEAAARVAMENRGLGLMAIWHAEAGACELCRPLHNQPEAVWAAVYPEGPPSPHPNCRCHLRYVRLQPGQTRESFEDQELVSELLVRLRERLLRT